MAVLPYTARNTSTEQQLSEGYEVPSQTFTILADNERLFQIERDNGDGEEEPPSGLFRGQASHRVRWAVTAGEHTISVKVKCSISEAPYPVLRVYANPSIGVNANVEGVAIAGTDWQTIGPITVSPTSQGALLVEIETPTYRPDMQTRWDSLTVT